MTRPIFEVCDYPLAPLVSAHFGAPPAPADDPWPADAGWVQTLSARSALRCILLQARKDGRLPDKNAQLLVPQWACNALYQSCHKVCFPTNRPTAGMAGVMVYHQYGFPQNIQAIAERCRAEGLFVVENGVNCTESYWDRDAGEDRSLRAGTIFSWPKMYPVVLGGALQSNEPELLKLARAQQDTGWRLAERWQFWARLLCDKSRERWGSQAWATWQGMAYAISDYGQRQAPSTRNYLTRQRVAAFDQRRRDNYARLREVLSATDTLAHLEADVVPFVVPLRAPSTRLPAVLAALREVGIHTGIYSFDMNRNVFEPRFEKVVMVPCHTDLDPSDMERIGSAILKAL